MRVCDLDLGPGGQCGGVSEASARMAHKPIRRGLDDLLHRSGRA